MANENYGVAISYCKFLTIVVLLTLSHPLVEALNNLDLMHHGTVKTIESEEGEVIDCVGIYKQPAFNHPLIEDLQYAQASQYDGIYYGLQAIINVWNPKTEEGGLGEFSISQVWVVSLNRSDPTNLNSVEAGWIVSPTMFGDNKTRFFIFWTRDNYRTTGCYNLNCPGFVQTNHKFIIGNSIAPVSTYNGKSYEISITIFKDGESGNWWLEVQGEVVGYWPSSIFTGLANNANIVSWGGEIINSRAAGHHTTTQMGSGHFAAEGFHKSSYFRNLKVIDDAGNTQDPDNLQPHVSNSKCYDLQFQENKQTSFGTCFYYGGPGYSLDCP
ncbi:uncharacterized protein LOC127790960 [Diospyros lotus]|uniref:uncharacterized protein LOC127790960 n=1 Tax=Diospyros lotus TaxID=55363 RepID=UPI00225A84DC|nr:uncharacterized protein LOC127790960 [Diospyros lotus]